MKALYPPQIDTWMPAFVSSQECKIYFSISPYNNIQDIKEAQVAVRNPYSNISLLLKSKYPNEIKTCSIYTDETREGNDKYYITLSPNDVKDGFIVDSTYRIQVRLVSVRAAAYTEINPTYKWLADNADYLSEWSTICLIRPISQPSIKMRTFDTTTTRINQAILSTTFLDIYGELTFANEDETEYLKQYQITFKDKNGNLIQESETQYSENRDNMFSYNLPYELTEENAPYRLYFTFTTNNGYTDTILWNISLRDINEPREFESIQANLLRDYGVVEVIITDFEPTPGNLAIRRACSEDNFVMWEDLHIGQIKESTYRFIDKTVKAGFFYKYAVQRISENNLRGKKQETASPVYVDFDTVFLTTDDLQVNVKLNTKVSSYKQTVQDQMQETIGSKYPYIIRNAKPDYKQFQLSGLISAFWHNEETDEFVYKDSTAYSEKIRGDYESFLTRDELRGDAQALFEEQNKIDGTTDKYDYAFEKLFRDKIIEFLNDGKPKLYRSMTEGNILVRLMNVSFTPNETLSRMVWDFSATLYEIDEPTLANCDLYGIQSLGAFDSNATMKRSIQIGQIVNPNSDINLIDSINNQLKQKCSGSTKSKSIETLNWVRFDFSSLPQRISIGDDGELKYDAAGPLNGYIVEINGKKHLIGNRGFFEVIQGSMSIYSLKVYGDIQGIIDYRAIVQERDNVEKIPTSLFQNARIGQVRKKWETTDNLIDELNKRYQYDYSDETQGIEYVDGAVIEAPPGTQVEIKFEGIAAAQTLTVNTTSILAIDKNEGLKIESLKFIPRDGETVYAIVTYSCLTLRRTYR